LAPAFTPRAVMTLVPHMVAATDETIAKLKAASNAPVNLREAMQRMTLEIAGRTMFSFGMEQHGATLRDFVMEYGDTLARPHLLDLILPLGWPSPQDFPRARFRKRWTRFIGMLMAERRAAGKNAGAPARDLFDLMDAARMRPPPPRCSGRCTFWRLTPSPRIDWPAKRARRLRTTVTMLIG
jgi:unspecific monooxygenase